MPPLNLHRRVRDILAHTRPLPAGADSPIRHFVATGEEVALALEYLEVKTREAGSIPAVADRHLGQFRQTALVAFVENLERFVKAVAAVCVNVLATVTADDRFDAFTVRGSSIAGHFGADTLGQALCEAGTWLDGESINRKFRDLLADASPTPPTLPPFHLFPQQPADERAHFDTLQLVWQLRHTVVHNVGVVTRSDAVRLRVLAGEPVEAPRVLVPTRADLKYLARFLTDTAHRANRRVAARLADLLTRIHADRPTLLDPGERAGYLARAFGAPVTVAGAAGIPPP